MFCSARCVPKSSVQCGTTCGGACPPECEDGSASPVSCKKFKYCVSGKWKMSYCKRGLVHASEEGNIENFEKEIFFILF